MYSFKEQAAKALETLLTDVNKSLTDANPVSIEEIEIQKIDGAVNAGFVSKAFLGTTGIIYNVTNDLCLKIKKEQSTINVEIFGNKIIIQYLHYTKKNAWTLEPRKYDERFRLLTYNDLNSISTILTSISNYLNPFSQEKKYQRINNQIKTIIQAKEETEFTENVNALESTLSCKLGKEYDKHEITIKAGIDTVEITFQKDKQAYTLKYNISAKTIDEQATGKADKKKLLGLSAQIMKMY